MIVMKMVNAFSKPANFEALPEIMFFILPLFSCYVTDIIVPSEFLILLV